MILADGAILPFDRKTGRQYLGTYIHPDNPDIKIEYSERFGYWRPVVVEIDPETKEEYYALVRDPDKFPDLEERMVYSTTISGYQSPIVEFNELRIPKHQGYRWDDFSIPEEDEDQTVS